MHPYVGGALGRLWLISWAPIYCLIFLFSHETRAFIDITNFDLIQRSTQPWLYSGKYQGDINIDAELLREPDEFVFYNAVKNAEQTWPNAEIPYLIDSAFSFAERHLIRGAFQSFHNRTCVRFRHRRKDEQDYLNIIRGKGCYSQIGRTGGKQEVSLGLGCHHHQTIVHELMHSVGFWHEHSRADRDDHVQVNWANIIPGAKSQFDKIPRFIQDLLDEPYDYFSVMHYEATAFATNARYSIESRDEKMTDLMGTGTDLSYGDIRKINKLYNCPMVGKDENAKDRLITETTPPSSKEEAPLSKSTSASSQNSEEKFTIEPEEFETRDPEEILRIFQVE